MSGSSEKVKLESSEVEELREIFGWFDRNKDGRVTQLELGSLLRSLGLKPSAEQIQNSNGLLDFSEFVALVEPHLVDSSPYTDDQLRNIFRVFDRDGNGYITPAELAHSMAKLGHALTADELAAIIREADHDGDGCISFHEFAQAITSAAAYDHDHTSWD